MKNYGTYDEHTISILQTLIFNILQIGSRMRLSNVWILKCPMTLSKIYNQYHSIARK